MKVNNKNLIKIISNKELITKFKNKIFIPPLQRPIDKQRISEMVKYQNNYYKINKYFNFLGVITLCKYQSKYYLIDGQHRYKSILKISNKNPEFKIAMQILDVTNENQIEEYFKIINKSIPVPELPNGLQNNIIKKIYNYFLTSYKNYFKNSKCPRKPNLQKNLFIEELSRLVKNITSQNEAEIINLIELFNTKLLSYLNKNKDCLINRKKVSEYLKECLDKATNKPLYIGLYGIDRNIKYEWINHIIKNSKNINNLQVPQINFTIKEKKKIIPKVKRKKVWENIFQKKIEGYCPGKCGKKIHIIDAWECGHRKAEKNGGTLNIKNLIPLCSTCNKSMGTMSFKEYIKLINN